MASSTADVIEMLKVAYNMELETVLNYLANSVNPDGVRAEEIKKSLAADIPAELGHAQQLANRVKQLGGFVNGSGGLKFGQQEQPPKVTTDITTVIKAVIKAEEAACAVQKNHLGRRRGRLRDAGHVHPTLGRRGRALDPLQGFLEGISTVGARRLKYDRWHDSTAHSRHRPRHYLLGRRVSRRSRPLGDGPQRRRRHPYAQRRAL